MYKGASKKTGAFFTRGNEGERAPRCKQCDQWISWGNRKGKWFALKYGTKEPHKCIRKTVSDSGENLTSPLQVHISR